VSIPEAIGLGVLQGLTEFLPVSSSGHLALAEHFLGVRSPGIAFEVFAHFGTALAVIVFFRRRVASIVVALVRALVGASHEPAEARLGVRLAVGTVPAVVVGYLSNDQIKSAFANPTLVSGLLVLTGCVLWLTRRLSPGARPVESLRDALVIGMAQAVAILPGISRSGSTISAGLALGVQREQAAEFAFLLSIPVILGRVRERHACGRRPHEGGECRQSLPFRVLLLGRRHRRPDSLAPRSVASAGTKGG